MSVWSSLSQIGSDDYDLNLTCVYSAFLLEWLFRSSEWF